MSKILPFELLAQSIAQNAVIEYGHVYNGRADPRWPQAKGASNYVASYKLLLYEDEEIAGLEGFGLPAKTGVACLGEGKTVGAARADLKRKIILAAKVLCSRT